MLNVVADRVDNGLHIVWIDDVIIDLSENQLQIADVPVVVLLVCLVPRNHSLVLVPLLRLLLLLLTFTFLHFLH